MARRRAFLPALLAVGLLVLGACASSPPPAAGGDAPIAWSRTTLGRPYNESSAHVDEIDRIDVNRTGLWLALGSQSDRAGALQKPAAWASSDDRSWRSIGMPVGPADVGSVAGAASFGPLGLVGGALGAGPDAVPSIWSTSTGWEWHGPTVLPLPSDRTGVTVRAIAHGPGGWVAVGGPVGGPESPPIFWYSSDGEQWALGDAGSLPVGSVATSVAATGDRYVAVVSSPSGADPSALLSSADGRTWQRQSLDGFDAPRLVGDVVRVRDWFVVPVDSTRLAVSRDGLAWQPGLTLAGLPGLDGAAPVPEIDLHDRGGALVASAGSGDRLWLWTTSGDQDLSDASATVDGAWHGLATPPDPEDPYTQSAPGTGTARVGTAGPTVVVIRPGGREQATWWTASEDGNWGRAVTDIPPPVRQWREAVEGLAADAGTVVAVGRADYRSPARSEGRTWYSSGTMQQWEEPIVNGNITDVLGVATDGARFVAVAVKGDAPVVLRSGDGRSWDEIDRVVPDPSSITTTRLGAGQDAALFGGNRPTGIVRLGGSYLVQTQVGGLWSSPDGIRWTSVDVGAGGPPRGPLCASANAGVDVPFRSADGAAWTRDAALDTVGGDTCAVATDGRAVGMGAGSSGLTGWLAAPGQPATTPVDTSGLGTVASMASRGAGAWLALGSTSDDDPEGDPAAWTSAAGTGDWQPIVAAMRLVRERGSGSLSASVVFNGRQVLGGTSGDAATVLIGPP